MLQSILLNSIAMNHENYFLTQFQKDLISRIVMQGMLIPLVFYFIIRINQCFVDTLNFENPQVSIICEK